MKPKFDKHIFICTNDRGPDHPRGDCVKCGGAEIRMRFVRLINKNGLKGKVRANKSGCLDVCEIGPAVVIYPQNIWYTGISVEDVDEIFEKSIIKDEVVDHLVSGEKNWSLLEDLRKKSK
mgnify:FL=1